MNLNNYYRKRVLITGGAGFIGSHLAEALVGLGAEVTVLDDFSNGKEENLAAIREEILLISGSVTDRASVKKLFSGVGFDFVFHLAAINLLRSLENPGLDLQINTLGTIHLLEAAKDSGVGRLIYSSTGSVYGEPKYQPQDEGHPLQPVSPYGISKLAAEKYVLHWNSQYRYPTIALRYYNVYGPRQAYDPKGGVIGIFLDRVLRGLPPVIEGSGEQERCFTFVDDVVKANLLAGAAPDAALGQAYNIGTTEITTVAELAEIVLQSCASSLRPQFTAARTGDVRSFRPKIELAQNVLKYSPGVPFAVGIKKTKEWLEKRQGHHLELR